MKVYKLGVVGRRDPVTKSEPIVDGHNLILVDQIYAAHNYRNRLCAAEIDRRNEYHKILSDKDICHWRKEVEKISFWVDKVYDGIHARSVKLGKRASKTPEETASLDELCGSRERLYKQIKEREKENQNKEICKKGLENLVNKVKEREKEERSLCLPGFIDPRTNKPIVGITTGSYQLIERAAKSMGKGNPPKFKKFTGEGNIALYFQDGLSWKDACSGNDKWLRIEPTESSKVYHCWFRVGTHPQGSRSETDILWAKFFIKDEKFPNNKDIIRWAILNRKLIGSNIEWSLQLTVTSNVVDSEAAKFGKVGIDVNWRMIDGDLRVAVACGNDDNTRECIIPGDLLQKLKYADDVKATRDGIYYELRHKLADFLLAKKSIPDWLREEIKTIRNDRQWCAGTQPKLVRIIKIWETKRFAFDKTNFGAGYSHNHRDLELGLFDALFDWSRQDKHLNDISCNIRAKALRRREHIFGNFVADLRRSYKVLRIEDIDWRSVARNPSPGVEEDAAIRFRRFVASPGMICEMIRRCPFWEEVKPEYTTTVCNLCGHDNQMAMDRKRLTHRCVNCGESWDQDFNAARNILTSKSVINNQALEANRRASVAEKLKKRTNKRVLR